MATTTTTADLTGITVTGRPVGQTRRQTFVVTRVDGEFVHGLLVSRKYPGDYRGAVTAYADAVSPSCPSCGADLDTGTADEWTCTRESCGDEWHRDTLVASGVR